MPKRLWRWDITLVNEKSDEKDTRDNIQLAYLIVMKQQHPEKFEHLKALIALAEQKVGGSQ